MEESKQETWLRKLLNQAPLEGPAVKHVKFKDVYNDIRSAFPETKFNHSMVSDVIKTTFPQSFSRWCVISANIKCTNREVEEYKILTTRL